VIDVLDKLAIALVLALQLLLLREQRRADKCFRVLREDVHESLRPRANHWNDITPRD
jgi:hypothetical protein